MKSSFQIYALCKVRLLMYLCENVPMMMADFAEFHASG